MPRRSAPVPSRTPDADVVAPTGAADEALASPSGRADLSDLPVLGITRRRAGYLLGVLLASWVLIVFARQVSDAAAASATADALRGSNAQASADVAALEHELDLIKRPAFIAQEARAYRIGTGKEIPFTLAPDAPSLAPDAPGSASVKLGAHAADHSPLDAWLEVLFGPAG
jgi:hypothetical protein